MSYYIGVDVGGTSVKAAVMDEKGKLYARENIPTSSGEQLARDIAATCARLSKTVDKAEGIGIGCPGIIDSTGGSVIKAANLHIAENFPLVKLIGEVIDLPVKITNDANAAAFGEALFGAGSRYKHSVFITLGTGVGGGVVINGKLFEGAKSAGAEIGHMVIERGGERCTCGRRGCFEAYSSATALIKRTKWAMEENPGSVMWKYYTLETVTGKTAFEFAETDIAASEVVDWYIKYLACGLINVANIFRPEVILLGGGVSGQGERLTAPIQSILDREIFGGTLYAPVKVVCASLGADAGVCGAAALWLGR